MFVGLLLALFALWFYTSSLSSPPVSSISFFWARSAKTSAPGWPRIDDLGGG
jgi:hypothetical protein